MSSIDNRASISIEHMDGTFSSIECRLRGSVDMLGVILYCYYSDVQKCKAVLDKGNLVELTPFFTQQEVPEHLSKLYPPALHFHLATRWESEYIKDEQINHNCKNYPSKENWLEICASRANSYHYAFSQTKNEWSIYTKGVEHRLFDTIMATQCVPLKWVDFIVEKENASVEKKALESQIFTPSQSNIKSTKI